ncbi:MAG: HipA domain-containing protein [Polyangiales bacterium]
MSLVRVRLGDVVVGEVERFDDAFDTHVFRWSAEYRTTPERPVLGQYMEDRLDRPLVTHGLTPWFEHLLPQGPLRGAVARDAGVDPNDGLALLAWLGEDLPGAVRVEVVRALRARPRRESVPVASADPAAVFRVSLPGVQWKLSLHATQKGLTLPTKGVEGEWIAKFHADAFPRIVALEDATLRWAAFVGVDVPVHRVVRCDDIDGLPEDVPRGDGEALVIDRFDRSPSGRIHVEDFGQVLDRPPGLSQYRGAYEEIGAVIRALCPDDRREFVRRVVFNCVWWWRRAPEELGPALLTALRAVVPCVRPRPDRRVSPRGPARALARGLVHLHGRHPRSLRPPRRGPGPRARYRAGVGGPRRRPRPRGVGG